MVSLAGVGRRFLCRGGFGRRVGPSNFKIGGGVGSGVAGADGANFEIGTPDPVVGTTFLGGIADVFSICCACRARCAGCASYRNACEIGV